MRRSAHLIRESLVSQIRGNVKEVAAAVGVILSLVFVGYEIRQNTQVSRASAVQSITEQIVQWQTAAAQNDDWIRIITFLTNGGTHSELSPEDRQRYTWVVTSTERFMEARFVQVQLGIIREEDLMSGGGAANRDWFQSQHFLDNWAARDQSRRWSPEFIDFMETAILELR
jgi:hypothetical protein